MDSIFKIVALFLVVIFLVLLGVDLLTPTYGFSPKSTPATWAS